MDENDILGHANAWADDGDQGNDFNNYEITKHFKGINETKLKKIGIELGDKLAERFTQKQIDAFLYQVIEGAKKSFEVQKNDALMEDKIGDIFEDVEPNPDKEKAQRNLQENNLTTDRKTALDDIDVSDLL